MHILRKKDNFQKTEWKVRNACYLWIILVKIWKKNFYIFYIILLHFFPLLTLTEAMSSHTETFHIHVVNFKSYYVNISDCFIKQISHQTLYLSILEKDVFQYKFLKGWHSLILMSLILITLLIIIIWNLGIQNIALKQHDN